MTMLLTSSLSRIRNKGINIDIGIATMAKSPVVAEGSAKSAQAITRTTTQNVMTVRGRTETERFSPTNAAMLQMVANEIKPIIVSAKTDSEAQGV